MKYCLFLSLYALILVACAPSSPMPTTTPSATVTLSPIPSITPSATPTPTETLTPTATSTPTIEEAFGGLAPRDYEYILSTDSFSSYYGPSYKMAAFNSFFTGNTRVVERFDESSKQNIAHTEIQVVLRDSNQTARTLWLSFGTDNFKGNWVYVESGNQNTRKDGSVHDLLKLLSKGSNIRFGVFWDTPAKPPERRWCLDSDPDFCNDYSFVKFYLARGNIEFLRNLRDGQFPDQAALDEMVVPVESITLVKAATPPVPTWEPLTELSPYDEFNGTELDKNLWNTSETSPTSPISYVVNDGVLELQAQTKNEAASFELRMARQLAQVKVFETQIRIPNRGRGKWGFVTMKLLGTLPDGREWVTECFVTGLTTAKPILGCNVNGDEHGSPQPQVKFNHWYTIRIEFDPTTGAIQYALDGQPIDAYLPENASDLIKMPLTPLIVVWVNENTELTVQIDNIRIPKP
jgi:hypothetical protein